MGQVVLLVVGAAWVVVLIPPLLRSRGQNRPNSSVADFRNQLSSLQKVSRTVHMRSMGRSLVASSLERPSPSRATPADRSHTSVTLHAPTGRAQGGGHAVGQPRTRPAERRPVPHDRTTRRLEGMRGERTHRQLLVERRDSRAAVKRRRANVLFLLVLTALCTLFLAVTTKSAAVLYVFAGVFAALAGYIYLLGQARQREDEPREIVDVTAPPRRPVRRQQQRQHHFDVA